MTMPSTGPKSDDTRPYEHTLVVTREACDVITQGSDHVTKIGLYFGTGSKFYLDAVASWQANVSKLFSAFFGSTSRITRDGDLSLFVSTSSGFVFGMIFHPVRRGCTVEGCSAQINDDGAAWYYMREYEAQSPCATNDTPHQPSYPLDAPTPGTWSFHS